MAHNANGLLQVPANQVVTRLGNPSRSGVDTLHLHHRTYQDLFPHPPMPSDVIQGAIGDCYLISALNSILNCPGGPEAIEKCFLDRSSGGLSGDVVMRLYDNHNVPNYFALSKSVVTGLGAQHTIWVKLFEKGYAALFLGGSYAGLETASGNEHGKGSDVFRAILGSTAGTLDCVRNDETFTCLMGVRNKKRVRDEVFAGDDGLTDKWWKWYPSKFAIWNVLVTGAVVYRLEDFLRFIEKAGDMPEDVREQVLNWLNTMSPLPGRRGTGVYTPAQQRIFSEITAALAQRKAVSAGTNSTVAKPNKVFGVGSAGEGKAMSGLAGGHAYSVLDSKQEDGLLWVQMENPWKNWGVRYEKGIYTEGPKKGRPYLKPRADPEAGKFWLEMCDFHKHFKNIFVAGVALPG